MKKNLVLIATLILLLGFGFSAYSKVASVSRNNLLYVKDHAGVNFLVLKVESCSLGMSGELTCAMKPEEGAKSVKAGPSGSFFDRLAYPG